MIFHLMSARGAKQPVREKFLDGKVQVISRSGLNHCESALIQALDAHGPTDTAPVAQGPERQILTLGNRTGILGQIASDLLAGESTLHSFDIHHHRAMEDNIVAAFRKRVQRICTADLPATHPWDWVLIQLNRGNFSTELVYDLIQQCTTQMNAGGQLMVAIEGTPLWLVKRLKNYFQNVQVSSPNRNVSLLHATNLKPAPKAKSFRSQVDVTLPDGIQFPMVTYPGVFAHRRSDEGGLALAESTDVVDGDHVLDMGCGAGLIGLGLSHVARLERLTLVDSHARAVKSATENLVLNQRETIGEVIHSEGREQDFQDHRERYSLLVGNPPYYSQNQVTQRFVELSHEVLRPGGRAMFVTKNPEWLARELAQYFGEVQYFSRRNYTILRAARD